MWWIYKKSQTPCSNHCHEQERKERTKNHSNTNNHSHISVFREISGKSRTAESFSWQRKSASIFFPMVVVFFAPKQDTLYRQFKLAAWRNGLTPWTLRWRAAARPVGTPIVLTTPFSNFTQMGKKKCHIRESNSGSHDFACYALSNG